MNSQHLFKYSKSHAIVKNYVAFLQSFYYSEICVIDPENVPESGPVIFAPNHQNALMDALAVLYIIKRQAVFMARADIFKKKLISEILTFLKIIPVYRIRDGINSMSQNDESFNIVLKALEYGQVVGIMPEGGHGDLHRLMPLKKGISRLAFKAQEKMGNSMNVKIVPVGIEYSHYINFRSKLLVIYGKPIEVNEYWDDYIANPPKTLIILQERLATEMKKLMLNIDSTEYYDLIVTLKNIYARRLQKIFELRDDYYGRFLAEKIITDF